MTPDAEVGVEQHREGLVAAPGLGDLERDDAVEPQGDRGVPQVLAADVAQRPGGEGGGDGVFPDVAVEVGQVDASADGVDEHQRVAAGGGEPCEVVAERGGDLVGDGDGAGDPSPAALQGSASGFAGLEVAVGDGL